MANHKRLYAVIKYLCESAQDPNAVFECDVSAAAGDSAGNRQVEITIKSRVPPAAAKAVLCGYDDGTALTGYGAIKDSSTEKNKTTQ
ncbi:MAG: hypothetical protein M3458_20790 [Acidobacteriota bacterium]|nr:hypothetical protein [Acidobacteriota bacterium]